MAGNIPPLDPVLVSYDSNPNGMFALLVVGFVVPIVVVLLRFAARKIERVSWWWDDYFALLSLLLFIAGFRTDVQIARYNSPNDRDTFLAHVFAANILYPLVASTTKISGLLLYVLHFGYDRGSARTAYALIALVAAWCVATVAATVFQCYPISAAWSASSIHATPGAQCLNRSFLFQATSIADAALTLLILLLPLPKIFRLDLRSPRAVLPLIKVYVIGLL